MLDLPEQLGPLRTMQAAATDQGSQIGLSSPGLRYRLEGAARGCAGVRRNCRIRRERQFAHAVELLCTITGVQRRTAEAIIAETGVDMSGFPSAKQLASWAGQCPGNDQSAGKRRSGKTRQALQLAGLGTRRAALAATRPHDTYLAAQYARLRPRRGHKRRSAPSSHSIIVACWHMLS